MGTLKRYLIYGSSWRQIQHAVKGHSRINSYGLRHPNPVDLAHMLEGPQAFILADPEHIRA